MAWAPNWMEPLGRRVGLHPSRGTGVRQGVNGCWRSKVAEYGLEPVSKARQTGLRQTDLAKENEGIHAGNKQTCHIVKILEGILVFERTSPPFILFQIIWKYSCLPLPCSPRRMRPTHQQNQQAVQSACSPLCMLLRHAPLLKAGTNLLPECLATKQGVPHPRNHSEITKAQPRTTRRSLMLQVPS